ncbi:hypothetical protein UFOVP12_51 [uncultured Caudovirales phage]|uniref:Uncharacterized protein n=1 Tax=uncultured Caudovirales phage TaxID=2100421 RepID=A0A6J5KMA0_9CAUD|nr:hypothetical protein UFOVP12_51 [uncultured Caudovirales phage]
MTEPKTPIKELNEDDIKNVWYSLGLRGGSSQADWNTRIRFAKAILKEAQEK